MFQRLTYIKLYLNRRALNFCSFDIRSPVLFASLLMRLACFACICAYVCYLSHMIPPRPRSPSQDSGFPFFLFSSGCVGFDFSTTPTAPAVVATIG
jgi:hypothetical protein